MANKNKYEGKIDAILRAYAKYEKDVMTRGIPLRLARTFVGRGWHGLLKEVYKEKPEDVKIIDVKEKWGGLRIYADMYDAEFADLLDSVETRSFRVCELCGKDGERVRTSTGWFKTLCHKCRKGR